MQAACRPRADALRGSAATGRVPGQAPLEEYLIADRDAEVALARTAAPPEYWNPKKRGPTCMNAPAVRSALPVTYRVTELVLAGLLKDAILARMKESIARKEFGPPESARMPWTLLFVPVPTWSDGTPSDAHHA